MGYAPTHSGRCDRVNGAGDHVVGYRLLGVGRREPRTCRLRPAWRPRITFAARMPSFEYRYELRRGEEVVATGHLTPDRPLEAGERIEIGGAVGTIRAIEPLLGERELRLVVEMWREAT